MQTFLCWAQFIKTKKIVLKLQTQQKLVEQIGNYIKLRGGGSELIGPELEWQMFHYSKDYHLPPIFLTYTILH